ncbi:hypothetical protein GCM10009634_38580 [Saccharothrix xinjiangensis]
MRAADAQAWADLMRAFPLRDRPVERADPADFAEELPGPDPSPDDAVGVFRGGDMVGYAVVRRPRAAPGGDRHEVAGGVHPDHRGAGLGSRLLDWSLARAEELGPRVEVWCADHNAAQKKLLAARGLRPALTYHEVYSRLDRVPPLSPPPLPEGLVLRTYDRELDEDVREAHNDAFTGQHEDGHVDRDRWRRDFTGKSDFLPELSYAVLDGQGRVVAHLLSYAYDGSPHGSGQRDLKVEYIGIRKGFRGRFLDRVLLAENDREARRRGYVGMAFSVDSANPSGALRVFQRIGVYDPERDDCTTWVRYDGEPPLPTRLPERGGRA